jgi:hypothetical protein
MKTLKDLLQYCAELDVSPMVQGIKAPTFTVNHMLNVTIKRDNRTDTTEQWQHQRLYIQKSIKSLISGNASIEN